MVICAKDYGVLPGNTDVKALEKLLDALKETTDKKELVFLPGDYIINSQSLKSRMFYITNTVGDREFSSDETPHKNRAMLCFEGIENLTVSGNGAQFIADGKTTNMALENCKNIKIRDVAFSAIKPDMHELRVLSVKPFAVDFEIDGDSDFSFENGKLYFEGRDYKVAADMSALNAHWIGLIRAKTPQKVQRVSHPLLMALKILPLGGRRFRAVYSNTLRFKRDDCFYLFDVRRQYAGIFLNGCKNIELSKIKQGFNYSLALVAQDCDTLTCKGLDFSPNENSPLKMASVADFIQICMCRGEVKIQNSNFDGAGDDCINTHGIHFNIKKLSDNRFVARFMHPQSHGFNPLRRGDTVAFINSSDMLEYGCRAEILSSKLRNEYEIELELNVSDIPAGCDVIEDISACPSLVFENNTLRRIITRAVLYTSRGKCLIKNNRFISNTMSGILLSDDAKSWYESGMCRDVTIEDNVFEYCGQTPILIKPENTLHRGAVHKNITIKNNIFKAYKGACIYAKSTDGINIEGNTFLRRNPVKTLNCQNVSISL